MKFKRGYILILIILLGFILRATFLNVSPPGFNADEAALGYNAYSILKTGKDEWGNTFPILLKSFGDYKNSLYSYLSIPFIALFGLNELSVKLLSIIVGTLSIFLIYLLAKEIFKKEEIGLACAFILAISPWHIQFSRAAWETNLATFFILLGVTSFLWGLKKPKLLILSLISFVLSAYTYKSPLAVVPLLVVFLGYFYRKELPIKRMLVLVLAGLILLAPLLFTTIKGGTARYNGISIFSDPGVILRENEKRVDYSQNPLGRILHNTPAAYAGSFLSHYLSHFDPNFLFISGDDVAVNNSADTGELYLFEVITIIVGLYFLARSSYKDKPLILFWLIVAPVASGLTFQTPNAIRAHNMIIPLSLISGFGLYCLIEWILRLKRLKVASLILLSLVVLFSFVHFLGAYFIELPKQSALEWGYGFPQVADYINQNENKYQTIILTKRYSQPYMMLLFFTQFDPSEYQKLPKTMGNSEFGYLNVAAFGKYQFKTIDAKDFNQKDTLIIGTQNEIGNRANVIKTVDYPNGQPAFIFVETK